jgi:predicted DNA-binding ribbon-helix-helix protein
MHDPKIVVKHLVSQQVKRNLCLGGRRTSMRFSVEVSDGLEEMARREGCALQDICDLVAKSKTRTTPLSRALRVHVFQYFREAATEDGHRAAGHGTIAVPGSGCEALESRRHGHSPFAAHS